MNKYLVDKPIESRKLFNVAYQAVAIINAPEEEVWDAINDPREIREWDSMIISINGVVEKGGWVRIKSRLNPRRIIRFSVTDYEPFSLMIWKRGIRPFFRNVREFRIHGHGGVTMLKLRETISGLFSPFLKHNEVDTMMLLSAYIADLKKKFENART